MYDKGKVIAGIVAFLAVVTVPVWYNLARGTAQAAPQLERPANATKCVESVDYMRANHKELLLNWRETVVREGTRTYVAQDGKEYDMNLVTTCLNCHTNKSKFCDQCHSYVGQQLDCWKCHIAPEELENWNLPAGSSSK